MPRLEAIIRTVPWCDLAEDVAGAVILFGLIWIAPYLIAIAKALTEGGTT